MTAAALAVARAVDYASAGTVEFLLDAGRPLLLPRDEHAAAGRAPDHRVGDRHRPGGGAAPRRARRAARLRAGRRRVRAATRSRCGSTPRIRPPASCRAPDRSSRSASRPAPGVRVDSGIAAGARRAGRLRSAAREALRLGRRPRDGDRAPHAGRAARHRHARADHQPRLPPATSSRTPRSRAAPRTRGSSTSTLPRGAPAADEVDAAAVAAALALARCGSAARPGDGAVGGGRRRGRRSARWRLGDVSDGDRGSVRATGCSPCHAGGPGRPRPSSTAGRITCGASRPACARDASGGDGRRRSLLAVDGRVVARSRRARRRAPAGLRSTAASTPSTSATAPRRGAAGGAARAWSLAPMPGKVVAACWSRSATPSSPASRSSSSRP